MSNTSNSTVGATILVVDDDQNIREFLDDCLQFEDFKVIQASNGEEALDVLKDQGGKIDAILLDNVMPGINGFEVFQKMQSIPKARRLPVVMLTGHGGVQGAVNFMNIGGDYYLTKPLPMDPQITISLLKSVLEKIIQDRKRKRQLYEEQVARKAAEELNAMKDDFLSKLGHELRTPVQGLLSFGGLAKRKLDAGKMDEAKMMLVKLLESKDRLLSLIKNIEHVAQLQTKCFAYKPASANLLPLVTVVKQQLHKQSTQKQIDVVVSGPKNMFATFDSSAMQIALIHLLENAIRFSPQGSAVAISIETHKCNALISVTDQGVGIPLNEQAAVFNAFAESSRTATQAKGTGLGLVIVKGIVKLHNGDVFIQKRTDGPGSIFTIRFPIQKTTLTT